MKGYVTWIFAILLIFAGMGMMLLSIKFPAQQTLLVGMGIQCIGIGGGLIGIGRKVEKQTNAIKDAALSNDAKSDGIPSKPAVEDR